MGELKALLPLGGEAVVTHQIRLFQMIGIAHPVVVTGHRAAEVAAAAEAAGARAVYNGDYDSGMFSSIRTGVRAAEADEPCGFFMLPVDIPLVTGFGLLRLVERFERGGADIVYPLSAGRRGHPPLISGKLIPEILGHSGDGGLRAVLGRHEEASADVENGPDWGIRDMDEPEAYAEVDGLYRAKQVLPAGECMSLLREEGTPPAVVEHSVKTAELAVSIGSRLAAAGLGLSVPLLRTAGLLHDIARARPNHAAEGARLLRLRGLYDAAEIVENHMNYSREKGAPLCETDIVYLSDKLLSGCREMPLSARRAESLEKKGSDAEIRRAINRRFDTAEEILALVEDLAGPL